jgi:hypothetical protein
MKEAVDQRNALQQTFDNANEKYDGLLVRLQALDQLSGNNPTLNAARLLLFLLFLVIECLPVSVRILQQPGGYEEIYMTAFEVREIQPELVRYRPSGTLGLNSEKVPDAVLRFLLPTERKIIMVHPHPGVLAAPFCIVILNTAAFVLSLAGFARWSRVPLIVSAILMPVLLYFFYRCAFARLRAYAVVTPLRILLIGWPRRGDFEAFSITDAEDMSFFRTPLARVAGYGAFKIKRPRPGRRRTVIGYLPFPERLYLEVAALIYREA